MSVLSLPQHFTDNVTQHKEQPEAFAGYNTKSFQDLAGFAVCLAGPLSPVPGEAMPLQLALGENLFTWNPGMVLSFPAVTLQYTALQLQQPVQQDGLTVHHPSQLQAALLNPLVLVRCFVQLVDGHLLAMSVSHPTCVLQGIVECETSCLLQDSTYVPHIRLPPEVASSMPEAMQVVAAFLSLPSSCEPSAQSLLCSKLT